MTRQDFNSNSADTLQARYERDGVVVLPEAVFPAALVQRALAGIDMIVRGDNDTGLSAGYCAWKPSDDPNRLVKIEQPHFASHAIRELLAYPAFGKLAAEITGASWVQVWHVQLLVKPPSAPAAAASTNVGWHQDRYYWSDWEAGSELFTGWIGLTDVGDDCGPMQLVRGSHRWGFRGDGNFFEQDIDGQRAAMALPPGTAWEEIRAVMPAGGVSFHNCLTYHGSGPNTSGRPRRSLAVHLRTERSRPAGSTAPIDDLTLCPVIYGARTS